MDILIWRWLTFVALGVVMGFLLRRKLHKPVSSLLKRIAGTSLIAFVPPALLALFLYWGNLNELFFPQENMGILFPLFVLSYILGTMIADTLWVVLQKKK